MRAARTNAPGARARRGFTLLEVVVAIAVGSLVVLGAHEMIVGVADGADAIGRSARASDREANGDALLRQLLRDLEVGTSDAAHFAGDSATVRFSTWCAVPGGWPERCRAELSIASPPGDATESGAAIVARLSTGESLRLAEGFSSARFLFLSDAALGGRWFTLWGEGITAPLAIGVAVERAHAGAARADTLILRIGERG